MPKYLNIPSQCSYHDHPVFSGHCCRAVDQDQCAPPLLLTDLHMSDGQDDDDNEGVVDDDGDEDIDDDDGDEDVQQADDDCAVYQDQQAAALILTHLHLHLYALCRWCLCVTSL